MVVDSLLVQASLGGAGGIVLEFMHWYSLSRKHKDISEFKTGVIYWIATIIMIFVAALMPIVYLEGSASALLCFHLGLATPLILQKLISEVPVLNKAQGFTNKGLRGFWRW
ncbi:hypothetical protein [Rheinheimera pacifica]|uniref:hypothetical protein n=1 Tax=Rheinheimera pacifica TaxID=173990 RepID=UPI002ED954E7